jgi:protein-S-isoprenylcysteine O-methyltransferase Ste14
MELVASIIFFTALAALIALNVLMLLTAFTDTVKLWPTPVEDCWQFYTFWTLFRGGLGLTIVASLIEVSGSPGAHWLNLALGVPLSAAGFGITIYGYFNLGLENTYGSNQGLVTRGLYSYSRNPQGVASMVGFLGLAIAAGEWRVELLAGLVGLVYVLFPFTEEPWLERTYGDHYQDYCRQTPRFLSLVKLLRD